jgi:hypothetical protein
MSATELEIAVLDLRPFCGATDGRTHFMRPFSIGEFTYATNGHIMVRVPRRPDAPEQTVKFNADDPLKGHDTIDYVPLSGSLPEIKKEDCIRCADGQIHDCPDCKCTCEDCGGSGKVYPRASTSIGEANFAVRYVAMMLALPNIQVAATPGLETPLLFRFDGGIGAVMPMHGKCDTHVEVSKTTETA